MKPDSPLWRVLGPSASRDEQAALDAVRKLIPDDGISTAWVNAMWMSSEGRIAEVDLVLLTKHGLFVVELKGWTGSIAAGQLMWSSPQWREPRKNPVLATEMKARWLKGLLDRTARRLKVRGPKTFIETIVLMHGQGSKIDLAGELDRFVWSLDGYDVKGLGPAHVFSEFLARPAQIDAVMARQLRRLMDEAGLKPVPRVRKVGDYVLDDGDAIADGPGWEDFLVTHPNTKARRRVRVFNVPPGSSASARNEIEARAARELRLMEGLDHPGLVAPLDYVNSDQGPALLFRVDEGLVRLDRYVAEHNLNLLDRLELVRSIAETVRYAHGHSLTHRSLSPKHIYVREADGQVQIRDWSAGRRVGYETSQMTLISRGESKVRELETHESWVYLAPETLRETADADPIAQDVFGIGALAYLVLTGHPPAATPVEYAKRVESETALDPLSVEPDMDAAVARIITDAAAMAPFDRAADVGLILQDIDDAFEAITAPDEEGEWPVVADPLDAAKGAVISDRFVVVDRRGAGGTAVAFAVEDYSLGIDNTRILKIARDDDAAHRLVLEAETLRRIDHPRIVRLIEGPIELDGREAILLSDAGASTLAATIRMHGGLTLGDLEHLSRDLFDAMTYLENAGIFHRDVKPSNLAVAPDPGTRRKRLNLFDLSLSQEPLDRTESGSRPYLEPFLRESSRQYDRAAELYAVAVTLFEMATGKQPWWRDGEGAPASRQDEAVVEEPLFDASVAHDLATFFRRALSLDPKRRFGNAADMAEQFGQVFRKLSVAEKEAEEAHSNAEQRAEATLDTLLAQSGLSGRAVSALSKLGATTVGEVLSLSPMDINRAVGLGEQYRREVSQARKQWGESLGRTSAAKLVQDESDGRQTLESLGERLVPRQTQANASEVAVMRRLLGLVPPPEGAPVVWPTRAELAREINVTPARVSQLVLGVVRGWSTRKLSVKSLVDDVSRLLDQLEGVATLDELATAVMMRFGSTIQSKDERRRRARGVVCAVLEFESISDEPRIAYLRAKDDTVLVARGTRDLAADALLETARALGARADRLLKERPIIPGAEARAVIRADVPEGVSLTDVRLLELAAAVSRASALSSFGEIFRTDVDAETATSVVLRGMQGRRLDPEMIADRVAKRFHGVVAMVDRPDPLDELVRKSHPQLRWNSSANEYTEHTREVESSSTRSMAMHAMPLEQADEKLRDSLASHSWMVLAAHPRDYDAVAIELRTTYGATCVDIAHELVTRARETAASKNVDWTLVLSTDAHPEGGAFGNVRKIMAMALAPLLNDIAASPEPILLTNVAPLARYGLLDEVTKWSDLTVSKPGARWLLVDFRQSDAAPTLDGHSVPFGADGWLELSPRFSNPGAAA